MIQLFCLASKAKYVEGVADCNSGINSMYLEEIMGAKSIDDIFKGALKPE